MNAEELFSQYLIEKSILEQYGHTSTLTFDEWKKVKDNELNKK